MQRLTILLQRCNVYATKSLPYPRNFSQCTSESKVNIKQKQQDITLQCRWGGTIFLPLGLEMPERLFSRL